MRDGFRRTPDKIQIGNAFFIQYDKGIQTFGRTIDMPVWAQWGCADEKDLLPFDEIDERAIEMIVDFSHESIIGEVLGLIQPCQDEGLAPTVGAQISRRV